MIKKKVTVRVQLSLIVLNRFAAVEWNDEFEEENVGLARRRNNKEPVSIYRSNIQRG